MTTDAKAPLPEGVNLKTAMRGITDYLGYEGSADICRAHIAELEATVLEREKELHAVGENRAHLERLSVGLISTNKVLEAANKRLREVLGAHLQADGCASEFPDNVEDEKHLKRQETHWRLIARSWLDDLDLYLECCEAAKQRAAEAWNASAEPAAPVADDAVEVLCKAMNPHIPAEDKLIKAEVELAENVLARLAAKGYTLRRDSKCGCCGGSGLVTEYVENIPACQADCHVCEGTGFLRRETMTEAELEQEAEEITRARFVDDFDINFRRTVDLAKKYARKGR